MTLLSTLLALTIVGADVPAAAAALQAPIAIDGCEIPQTVRSYAYPRSLAFPMTDALRISFHDRAAKPITSVTFLVDYRGETEAVQDAGHFEPDAHVDHTYDGT